MGRGKLLGCIRAEALALTLAAATTAGAQTSATVDVSVDATAPGTPIERIWAFHGYDEVNYTTTAEGQDLLKTLGTIHSTPPHIRSHFLLNTGDGTPSLKWGSTNVYTEDAAGNPVYSWTLLDGIMDTVTGAGAFPYAEIGFMPEALSTHPTPYMNSGVRTLDGGCFYPPTDYSKWGALITAWAGHSGTRYANAAPWQWELWNEPDIGYWQGTAAEYQQLFDYTEAALHGVLPNTPLGGPATSSPGAFLTQFLQHCSTGTNAVTGKTGTRLDMVSFHAKGGTAVVNGSVEMNLGHQLDLHRTGFTAIAAFPQYKQTPIVVSEADPDGCAACPASTTPADAYRNSPAYGAYEVAMMKHTLELEAEIGVNVRGLVTWAFLFENQPYFIGYRVLQTNGVHLPVLNAFRLLGSLNGMRLPATSSGALTADAIIANSVRAQPDVDAMATLNGAQVQIIVWNYHDDLVAATPSPVHLTVKLPPAFETSAVVNHLRVDDSHGDAYTVWTSQGSPAAPSATQLAQLQAAADDLTFQPSQAVAVVGGVATVDFDLPRFGVSLLTFTPAGLSDASVGDSSVTGGAGGPEAGSTDGAASSSGARSPSPEDAASSGDGSSGVGGVSSSGSAATTGSSGSAGGGGAAADSGSGGAGNRGTASSAGGGAPAAPARNVGCGCHVDGPASTPSTKAAQAITFVGLPVVLVRRRRRGRAGERGARGRCKTSPIGPRIT
jgi:xylan 1,4-beta-xylosidase